MLLPALLVVVCVLLYVAEVSGRTLPRSLFLQGGKSFAKKPSMLSKKSVQSTKKASRGKASIDTKRKSRKSRFGHETEHDDDDDDDDEDSEDFPTSRSKARGSRRGRQQLVPWASPSSFFSPKRTLSTLKRSLGNIAKSGSSAYKTVYRRAKVMKSSAFEGILLRATWPSNDPVPPALLTEIIKYSVPAFKYSASDVDNDPYYMTMHKLWTKMAESDWRTVAKSLYILHCISRDSSVDACNKFSAVIKDMSKERNPKQPKQRYFDLRQITALDSTGKGYEEFIKLYAQFTLLRAKAFSNRFEELKTLPKDVSCKALLALIKNAEQLMSLGMKLHVDKSISNVITGQALKLVASDLRELWKLYVPAVELLLSDRLQKKGFEKQSLQAGKTYQSIKSELPTFLSSTAKALQKLSMKVSADVEQLATADQQIASQIDKLAAMSGGFSRNPMKDDDYDDEDNEDEDEDEVEDEEESIVDDNDDDDDDDDKNDDDDDENSDDQDEPEDDSDSEENEQEDAVDDEDEENEADQIDERVMDSSVERSIESQSPAQSHTATHCHSPACEHVSHKNKSGGCVSPQSAKVTNNDSKNHQKEVDCDIDDDEVDDEEEDMEQDEQSDDEPESTGDDYEEEHEEEDEDEDEEEDAEDDLSEEEYDEECE